MNKPITWRNVNGPDLRSGAAILGQAQQSFDKAFSGAQGVISDWQGIQEGNQENQVRLNTEDFLNTINRRFQDPAALEQAQQSGELDALRQQFGQYGLDTAQTNVAAIDSLVGERRTQRQADQEYADFETQLGNRSVRDAHDVAIAEGRFDDAAKIRAENDFLNEGAMAQAQTSAQRSEEELNWTREQRNNSRQDRAEQQRQKQILEQGRGLATQKFLEIQEQGLNPTQGRNQLFEELMGIPGMTLADATGIVGNMDNADFLTGQLSKRDQTELNKGLAEIDKDLAKNEFTQWEASDESPADAANRVVKSAQAKIDDGWDQEEIHDFALVAMTEGFDLGTGEKQPLPPAAVEFLINHPDVGALFNGNPEAHVQRLIIKNPYWKKKLNESAQGKIDKKTYQTEYLKNTLGNASQVQAMDDRRKDADTVGWFLESIKSREQ